jgi:C-terminal processing protease CtpA/Prc
MDAAQVPAPAGLPGDMFDGCEGTSLVHQTFNVFWRTLDREYALFDIRLPGAQWSQLGSALCSQLDDALSDDALYELILQLARHLDDGHVNVEAENLDRDESAQTTIYPHEAQIQGLKALAEKKVLGGKLKYRARDALAWGAINDVGYLSLGRMDELSASGAEADDVDEARKAMSEAIRDLAACRALIVDVRANEGGWDQVSLTIASFFVGPRALVWSKRRRDGPAHGDFGPWQDIYLEVSKAEAFAGKVVILTSGATFSAAETFALAMRTRSDVTIVGERSSGHFSDMEDGQLPNGWTFTYSAERYRAADGQIYEKLGVPVDVTVQLDPVAIALGKDNMLEAALALLVP